MERIIDPDCDDGIGFMDPLCDLWRHHLIVEKKKIFWESLYEIDLVGRGINESKNAVPVETTLNGGSVQEMMEVIKGLIKEATKKLEDKMDDGASEIKAMVADLDERLDVVECYVNEQRSKKAQDRGASDFPLTPTTRFTVRTPVENGSEEEDEGDAGEQNDDEENDEEENDEETAEEKDEEEKDESDAYEEKGEEENDEEENDKEENDEENEEQVAEPMTKKRRKETPAEKKQRLQRTIKPSAAVSSPFVPGQAKRREKGKGKTTGKAAGGTTRRYNTRSEQYPRN